MFMKQFLVHAILLLIIIAGVKTVVGQPAPSKYKLKVLFVGYDPAKPMPQSKRTYPGMMSKEAFTAEYPVRMPAFKELLSNYFTEVKTIDCRDWNPSDSDPFDVTVFDFAPKAIKESKYEKDSSGKTIYEPARYLPDNFSKPVVFISSTASEMGSAIGLKLDWLCLCLDADAHHLNGSHAIFKGPVVKAAPTMEIKKTPDGIFHYASGANVPKQIPMWKVQNIGYLTGKDCRIGLVSRGERFLEGPDAEMISSGVCAKDVGAIALGRHGNFFLWGFGASPAQMTEEGKKVFVNVVAYMKGFNGKYPITKKYNEKMATTEDVLEIAANTTEKSFQDYKKQIEEFNEQNAKEKKRLDEKQAAGQELTSQEQESLAYIGNQQELPTWEGFLKQTMGDFYPQFANDAPGFQKYIRDNAGYIYCDAEGFFSYTIDSTVQKIGVSNHSIKLLDVCIDMLKRGDQPDIALSVLKKYTWENFTTANEWSKWLSTNRKKLFFSETNGYKFMINTYN